MFSKAVLTLLTIGALWLNVSATPIPATMHIRDPSDGSSTLTSSSYSMPPASAHSLSASSFTPSMPSSASHTTSDGTLRPPSRLSSGELIRYPPHTGLEETVQKPWWKPGLAMWGGELPRSFSALSYRDLTFVFSVAGVTAAGASIGTGIGFSLSGHNNHTRRDFGLESEGSNYVPSLPVSKREPLSEDEASDSLSSPLKRDPGSAPPSL